MNTIITTKMDPRIELHDIAEDAFGFTLTGLNVSLANGLRRTMLSDIPIVVFRTTPYEKNRCKIITNTSRFNNEILKQRLSCIPIHINNFEEFQIEKYYVEVNVANETDTIIFITTEDFVIKDKTTDEPLSKERTREIFPPNPITGDYIDFARLRPRISAEIPGEAVHLTCTFDIGTSKEDGMFNAVYTCSYGFTIDEARQEVEIAKMIQKFTDEGKTKKEIDFEVANWRLLEGKRIFKPDSYDYVIQSVGIYSELEIAILACNILVKTFTNVEEIIEKDELEIKESDNTMSNCYDVILNNYDYTVGKIIEYLLNIKFYETNVLTFCGFNKPHPHLTYSIIRVAYAAPVEIATIKSNLLECIGEAKELFKRLKTDFTRLVK